MKNLYKPSASGYEVTVCIHHETGCMWHWAAIRYPLDLHNTEETEILHTFDTTTRVNDWVDWLKTYGAEHPEDGICFD